MPDAPVPPSPVDRLVDGGFRAAMAAAMALPYDRRIAAFGTLVSRVFGPAAGFTARARDQLALALPELDTAERRRLARLSVENMGRSIAEIYSASDFTTRHANRDSLTGPGLEPLLQARGAGRPVILVTAHFGNLLAPVAAFAGAGHPPAMLYRPMTNPLSEAHWAEALLQISAPLFGRDRRGLAAMARHVRSGGFLALAADQHVAGAPRLDLFGQPARTTLSPATLALKHDGLLVPAFAVRQADGLSHRVEVQAPISHAAPDRMMQDYNQRLEAIVRRHPGQWLWPHRRWKG